MFELFVGVVAAIAVGLISITTMKLLLSYYTYDGVSASISATIGVALIQLIWGAIAAILLTVAYWYIIGDKNYAIVEGYNASFALLGALIMGFMAYKVLRMPQKHMQPLGKTHTKPFLTGLKLAITNPYQCLAYLGLVGMLAGHHVNSSKDIIFVMLGTGFGSFILWSGLIGLIKKHNNKIDDETILRLAQVGAGFIFILIVISILMLKEG